MRAIILIGTLCIIKLISPDLTFGDDKSTSDHSHIAFRFAQPESDDNSEGELLTTITKLPDYELLEEYKLYPEKKSEKWWVLKKEELTERDIEDVEVQIREWDDSVKQFKKELDEILKDNPYIKPTPGFDKDISIQIKFNNDGAIKFQKLTSTHKGERLAIILDNMIITVPVIQEEIKGGVAVILGITEKDALTIGNKMRSYLK